MDDPVLLEAAARYLRDPPAPRVLGLAKAAPREQFHYQDLGVQMTLRERILSIASQETLAGEVFIAKVLEPQEGEVRPSRLAVKEEVWRLLDAGLLELTRERTLRLRAT